ncbi:hypothetical protein MTO96_009789 [Rhipicephalus appendiculatus]
MAAVEVEELPDVALLPLAATCCRCRSAAERGPFGMRARVTRDCRCCCLPAVVFLFFDTQGRKGSKWSDLSFFLARRHLRDFRK